MLDLQPPQEKSAYSDNLIQLDGFKGKSYWLDEKTIMCEPDRLCNYGMELPRINYKRNGKPYRFVYAMSPMETCLEPEKVFPSLQSISDEKVVTFNF